MTTTELKDLLGTCTITFKQRIADLIKLGNKGKLCITVADDSLDDDYSITSYKSRILTIEDSDLKTQIELAFKHSPSEIIVFKYKSSVQVPVDSEDVSGSGSGSGDESEEEYITVSKRLEHYIDDLKKVNFNWICSLDAADQQTVANYCIENQVFGLVYNIEANSKYVVSLNNSSYTLKNGIKIGDSSVINGVNMLPYIGGLLAGCPYDMAVTGFVLNEIESAEAPQTYSVSQMSLYNDEEGVRVANPVNTLKTLTSTDTEDMKSIAIMEGIKRFDVDVKYGFRIGYKGRYKNKYDNQQLFISAVKGYIKELTKLDILDEEYDNTVIVNTDRMRELWIASGKPESEINSKSDLEIAKLTYKKSVLLKCNVKFLNAIEDCDIVVEMY